MSYRTRAAQAVVLCGALILTACAGPSQNDMYAKEKASVDTVTKKQVKPKKATLSARRLAAIRELGLDHQPRPAKLVGVDGFDVEEALGKPDFIRKDDGVEIWQYRTAQCILDLFLYQKRGHLSVDHSELRGALPDHPANRTCFKSIVTRLKT